MNKTVKIIAGFAVGAVAGAVLGMLIAPGKTSEEHKKPCDGGKAAGFLKNKLTRIKVKPGYEQEQSTGVHEGVI